jgi:antitoxin component YwqK of YwqJK toxin-antitoxin module
MKSYLSKLSFTAMLFVIFIACDSGSKNAAGTGDFSGYIMEEIAGSSYTQAILKDAEGKLLEEGPVLNGQRNGTWIKYAEDGRIQLLSSYRDGLLNGPVLRFSNRGQIEEKTFYKDNLYHGPRVTYKFGRPQQEMNYFENELDGMKRKYQNNGKIQEEVEYSRGVQDGIYRFYDDQGNMTLDYLYKNGEKVSGGIVEPPVKEGEN